MVCVDLNEDRYVGDVVTVVLGNDHEDVHLVRGDRGQFLVYDENMRHTYIDEATEARAITTAEHREWPERDDREEGHDALRYPFLYCVDGDGGQGEDDLEEDYLYWTDLVVLPGADIHWCW